MSCRLRSCISIGSCINKGHARHFTRGRNLFFFSRLFFMLDQAPAQFSTDLFQVIF